MSKTKLRTSNLELYRIIVMLLIVAHHYVVNSGLSVLGVFVVCSIIDMIRIKFVETPFFNCFDKVYDRLCLWFNQKKTYIFRKLNIKED